MANDEDKEPIIKIDLKAHGKESDKAIEHAHNSLKPLRHKFQQPGGISTIKIVRDNNRINVYIEENIDNPPAYEVIRGAVFTALDQQVNDRSPSSISSYIPYEHPENYPSAQVGVSLEPGSDEKRRLYAQIRDLKTRLQEAEVALGDRNDENEGLKKEKEEAETFAFAEIEKREMLESKVNGLTADNKRLREEKQSKEERIQELESKKPQSQLDAVRLIIKEYKPVMAQLAEITEEIKEHGERAEQEVGSLIKSYQKTSFGYEKSAEEIQQILKTTVDMDDVGLSRFFESLYDQVLNEKFEEYDKAKKELEETETKLSKIEELEAFSPEDKQRISELFAQNKTKNEEIVKNYEIKKSGEVEKVMNIAKKAKASGQNVVALEAATERMNELKSKGNIPAATHFYKDEENDIIVRFYMPFDSATRDSLLYRKIVEDSLKPIVREHLDSEIIQTLDEEIDQNGVAYVAFKFQPTYHPMYVVRKMRPLLEESMITALSDYRESGFKVEISTINHLDITKTDYSNINLEEEILSLFRNEMHGLSRTEPAKREQIFEALERSLGVDMSEVSRYQYKNAMESLEEKQDLVRVGEFAGSKYKLGNLGDEVQDEPIS